MRTVSSAFLLLLALGAGACRTAPAMEGPRPLASSPDVAVDPARLVARFVEGDVAAEARLAALGPDAVRWLRPFLSGADRELRMRAGSVLLSAGEDSGITERERIEVLLFDTERDAPAFVALRALGQLRGLDPEGRAILEETASGTGPGAAAARRLLRSRLP